MNPEEFIVEVNSQGIKVTRSTLLNYEKWGLISTPERGGGGTGGFWTNYPFTTIFEFVAGWKLLHGRYGNAALEEMVGGIRPRISPRTVKKIREASLNISQAIGTVEGDCVDNADIMNTRIRVWQEKNENLYKELTENHGPVYANFFMALVIAWGEEHNKALMIYHGYKV